MDEVLWQRQDLGELQPFIDPTWEKLIPFADINGWEGRRAPERQWLLQDWIPDGQATYLTGPGSAGKSLLGQLLCTCIAAGLPFMGVPVRQTFAHYLSCEDDTDEQHRRQEAICEALDLPMGRIAQTLRLTSLAGQIGAELARFDGPELDEYGNAGAIIQPTARFRALEGMAIAHDIGFITLDNVAHLFAGNENIRVEVAGFVSLLNRLARSISGAVLLIGHPNKAGDSFSGSTAWENQVRSRLYLEAPKEDDGSVADRDARVLSRQKSNYAENGATLKFRWHKWSFVRDEDLPSDHAAELAETIKCTNENDAFLACLRVRASQGEGRLVGPSPGPNYAPAQFEGMPQAKGLKKPALKRAMDRLYTTGQITTEEVQNKKSGRSAFVIRELPEGSHNAPHNGRTTLSPNAAHPSAQPGTTHTHISKDIRGAALGSASPHQDQGIIWDDDGGEA